MSAICESLMSLIFVTIGDVKFLTSFFAVRATQSTGCHTNRGPFLTQCMMEVATWGSLVRIKDCEGADELSLALESLHSDAAVTDVVSSQLSAVFEDDGDDDVESSSGDEEEEEQEDQDVEPTPHDEEEGDNEKTLPALGGTFWIGATDEPRCTLEKLALSIFRFHASRHSRTVAAAADPTRAGSFDPARSGAEWWCQIRPSPLTESAEAGKSGASPSSSDRSIGFHFDKDEWAMAQNETAIHPITSTVTYLSSGIAGGAPTVILDRMLARGAGGKEVTLSKEPISRMFVSHPRILKHTAFDGRLLHGVPARNQLLKSHCNVASQLLAHKRCRIDIILVKHKRLSGPGTAGRHRPLARPSSSDHARERVARPPPTVGATFPGLRRQAPRH